MLLHPRLAARFVEPNSKTLAASAFVGIDVYNRENVKLGSVADLAIENGKTITGVVVRAQNGAGDRFALLDPATMIVQAADGAWLAIVDVSQDAFQKEARFDHKEDMSGHPPP